MEMAQKKIEVTLYFNYRNDAEEDKVFNGAIIDDIIQGISGCDWWYDISKIKIKDMKRTQYVDPNGPIIERG